MEWACTNYAEHPGGQGIILKYAGKDATEEYDPIHPPDTLDKYLDRSKHLGDVDMETVEQEEKTFDPEEAERQDRIQRMPPLQACYNLVDFETVAKRVMKRTAWAYYSSGADDEIVRLRSASHAGSLTGPDDARKPLGLPQNLVPTPGTR